VTTPALAGEESPNTLRQLGGLKVAEPNKTATPDERRGRGANSDAEV